MYLHKTSKDLPAQVGVLLAVSGENTDEIAHDVAVHIAAMSPKYLDSESIPADQIETEKRVARETAIAEGKPEKILDKIVEGRLKGFFKENTLLDQDFAKELQEVCRTGSVRGWRNRYRIRTFPRGRIRTRCSSALPYCGFPVREIV